MLLACHEPEIKILFSYCIERKKGEEQKELQMTFGVGYIISFGSLLWFLVSMHVQIVCTYAFLQGVLLSSSC